MDAIVSAASPRGSALYAAPFHIPTHAECSHCAPTRANRDFGTDRNHPYQNHGYD
jgi:hypothetical protein